MPTHHCRADRSLYSEHTRYDAFDRRTGKEVDSDADGTIDRAEAWVWQGDQVALQLIDADGDGAGTWKLTNRYLYGDIIDMVLADEQLPGGGIGLTSVSSTSGTVLWPLADHLGSVRDLVDSNGVIREHVVYDSFGSRLSESDFDSAGNAISGSDPAAVDHLFGYTGREWDDDVDLQYNRARWYDPQQGRWISQDPIGFNAGDANLYRYVGNGPTNAADPSGLQDPVQENADYFELILKQRQRRVNKPIPTPRVKNNWNPNKPVVSGGLTVKHRDGRVERLYPSNDSSFPLVFDDSKTNAMQALGFTKAQLDTSPVKMGCFGIATARMGRTKILATLDDVERYTSFEAAYSRYLVRKGQGKTSRIALLESKYAPTLPPGHNDSNPLPASVVGKMHWRKDYATLHYDPRQCEFYWESVHDATGGLWHAAEPVGFSGTPYRLFLVVPIAKKHEDSPLLPYMPE